MWRQQKPESSAFGRHFLPLGERVLHLLIAAGICLLLRRDIASEGFAELLPAWCQVVLKACIVGLIFVTIPQWLFPATVVSPAGIRRHFAAGRNISWEDIGDFTVGRAWGVKRVYVQLLNGRKHRLDGVPLTALAALRHQLGLGELKVGSWWLVDYA